MIYLAEWIVSAVVVAFASLLLLALLGAAMQTKGFWIILGLGALAIAILASQ